MLFKTKKMINYTDYKILFHNIINKCSSTTTFCHFTDKLSQLTFLPSTIA